MKAVIATILRHEGYLPVEHNRWYKFKFQDRDAAVLIKRLAKGMQIEDNLNHLERKEKWVELKDTWGKITSGHIVGLTAVDKDNKKYEQLFACYKSENDKEVFLPKPILLTFGYTSNFMILEQMYLKRMRKENAISDRYSRRLTNLSLPIMVYFIRGISGTSKRI